MDRWLALGANDFDYTYNAGDMRFRIQKADGKFLNTGTDKPSWFTLEQARKTVDYSKGQRIVEHDGVNVLWEIF